MVQKALDEMLIEHEGVAVVVAHRLTTVKNCDRIVVMEKGQKVEEGTHKDLLAIQVRQDEHGAVTGGYYHHQWDTQMGEESFAGEEHRFESSDLAGLGFSRR